MPQQYRSAGPRVLFEETSHKQKKTNHKFLFILFFLVLESWTASLYVRGPAAVLFTTEYVGTPVTETVCSRI